MAPPVKWNKETAHKEALRFDTKEAFRRGCCGAYKWAWRQGVLEELCGHMNPQFRWTYDLVSEEAKKFSSRGEFHKGNPSAAQWATRHKIMDDLLPHKLTFWNLSSVNEKAENYETREDFRKHAAGAAQWAIKNGYWDEVCANMANANAPVTMSEARRASRACSSRSEFYYDHPRAYAWALRAGVIDELCHHMADGNTVSDKNCVYFWSPKGYPDVFKVGVTSQRLSDRRVRLVARDAGLEVDTALFFHADDALSIERQILNMGKAYDFPYRFNGYTEFRQYSPEEIDVCFSILGELDSAPMEASA